MIYYTYLPPSAGFSTLQGAWDSLQKQVPGLFVSWHTPLGELRGCWKPSYTESVDNVTSRWEL